MPDIRAPDIDRTGNETCGPELSASDLRMTNKREPGLLVIEPFSSLTFQMWDYRLRSLAAFPGNSARSEAASKGHLLLFVLPRRDMCNTPGHICVHMPFAFEYVFYGPSTRVPSCLPAPQ